MSQSKIMGYLEGHPEQLFTAKEIHEATGISLRNTNRALSKIIKREEYKAKITQSSKSEHLITLYGRKEQ